MKGRSNGSSLSCTSEALQLAIPTFHQKSSMNNGSNNNTVRTDRLVVVVVVVVVVDTS
jgi:hypothetical protein